MSGIANDKIVAWERVDADLRIATWLKHLHAQVVIDAAIRQQHAVFAFDTLLSKLPLPINSWEKQWISS